MTLEEFRQVLIEHMDINIPITDKRVALKAGQIDVLNLLNECIDETIGDCK